MQCAYGVIMNGILPGSEDVCSYEQLFDLRTSGALCRFIWIPKTVFLIGRLRGVEFPLMPPDGGRVSEGMIDTIKVWMLQEHDPE